jgi:hypothetical protein
LVFVVVGVEIKNGEEMTAGRERRMNSRHVVLPKSGVDRAEAGVLPDPIIGSEFIFWQIKEIFPSKSETIIAVELFRQFECGGRDINCDGFPGLCFRDNGCGVVTATGTGNENPPLNLSRMDREPLEKRWGGLSFVPWGVFVEVVLIPVHIFSYVTNSFHAGTFWRT